MISRVKIIALSFFLVLSFGCNDEKVIIPGNIIPRDKMLLVMTDVHLVESLIIQGHTLSDKSPEAYYEGIYKNHNITKEQFEESYSFYVDHPELFDEIYSEILIKLSEQQAEVAN